VNGLDRCYACGKPFRDPNNRQDVFLPDDDHRTVLVGPECFRHVVRAAAVGYQPPRGGPRLFIEKRYAERYADNQ
jgi:hypothetical protein